MVMSDKKGFVGRPLRRTLWGMVLCTLLFTGCAGRQEPVKESIQEKSGIEAAIDSFVGDDYTQIDVQVFALGEVRTLTLAGDEVAALKISFQDAEYEPVTFAEGEEPGETEGGAACRIQGVGGKQDMELTLYLMGGDERVLQMDGAWVKVVNEEELPLEVD